MNPFIPASLALVGAIIGALIGAVSGHLGPWWERKRRHRASFAALSAEIDLCKGLADSYLRDAIQAPLYRLPKIVYDNAFPKLLEDGAVNEEEGRAFLRFYGEADQINRGLDRAQDALDEKDTEVLARELPRLRGKCENLTDAGKQPRPGGPYYERIRKLLDARLLKTGQLAKR